MVSFILKEATNRKDNDKWLVAMLEDGVTTEEQDLGISEIAQGKEGYWLQVDILQERSTVRKGG